MSWVAAGTAAAVVVGGLIQSDSANSAANKQGAATKEGLAAQKQNSDAIRADQAPYRAAGLGATTQLSKLSGTAPGTPKDYKDWTRNDFVDAYKKLFADRGAPNQSTATFIPEIEGRIGDLENPEVRKYFDDLGLAKYGPSVPGSVDDPATAELTRKFTMEDFQNDPVTKASFDFGLSEGEKAVKRMFGSRGLGRSGAAVKGASRFATDYTGTKAGESEARFEGARTNVFNKLASEAGLGQTANQVTAGASTNTANNSSALLSAEGNARGAAAIAQGNAMSGSANTISNNIMGQYTLDRILSSRPNSQPTTQPQYSLDT